MPEKVDKKIVDLIVLSKLDREIVEIERKKKQIPLKIKDIQNKLQKCRASYKNLMDETQISESRKKVLEGETQEFLENVKASKAKLYDIKTNEAYKKALKEIDNWEHEIKQRENEILEIMEKLEKTRPAIDELREKFKPEETDLLQQEKSFQEALLKFDETINKISKEREKSVKNIDTRLYRQYERIRKAKGRIARVEITEPICTGCNLGIRPQLFNQLIKGEMRQCPNCSRLMYYIPPDE